MFRAIAAGVDWIEADIWLHYGRLVARHDRRLWRLPITYSRRSVSLILAPALVLDTLLEETHHPSARILIDLKGRHTGLPDALVDAIGRREAFDRTALCGKDWSLLDRARALDSRMTVAYSVGKAEQLRRYFERRRDHSAPPLISCFHRLLTPATVDGLKAVDSTILAWTVDSEARARELLGFGVDGITSNRLQMLRRLGRYPSDRDAAPHAGTEHLILPPGAE